MFATSAVTHLDREADSSIRYVSQWQYGSYEGGSVTDVCLQYNRDWYGEGMLPSVPGGAPFPPSLSKAMLLSHQVVDSLYKVRKMMHSSEVKLQAAR